MLLDEVSLARPISPLLAPLLVFTVQLYYKAVRIVYAVINAFVPRKVVPFPAAEDEHLIFCSATDLAEKIRQGEVTSTELLETYIKRVEIVNSVTNAIVERNYEDARKNAKEIDDYLDKLDKNSDEFRQLASTKPLLGVPFSVKDHINVKGLKTTVGMTCFKDLPPSTEDAALIKSLRLGGGIPFLMTNVPESVMWFEGLNTVYGRSVNAYDSRRACGGSSSGEGALLGGGGTIFGIGTDIAGSIRNPSLLNGIYGIKPGPGLTDLSGVVPGNIHGYQAEMVGIGPMCRYSKDLTMLLKLFVGPENSKRLRLDEPVDLSSVQFYSMAGTKNRVTSPPLDSDVLDAFNKAIDCFENQTGRTVVPVDFPLAKFAANYWFTGFTCEGSMPISNFFTGFTPDKKLEVFPELRKWFFGESNHTTAALLACVLEEMSPLFKCDRKQVVEMRQKFRQQILDLLGENGVLIWPSFPSSGYFHNELLWQFLAGEYTAIWNSLCLPAIACPMGLNSSGIPTGVQIVCAPNNERLLIACAQELERNGFKWTHPRL